MEFAYALEISVVEFSFEDKGQWNSLFYSLLIVFSCDWNHKFSSKHVYNVCVLHLNYWTVCTSRLLRLCIKQFHWNTKQTLALTPSHPYEWRCEHMRRLCAIGCPCMCICVFACAQCVVSFAPMALSTNKRFRILNRAYVSHCTVYEHSTLWPFDVFVVVAVGRL